MQGFSGADNLSGSKLVVREILLIARNDVIDLCR